MPRILTGLPALTDTVRLLVHTVWPEPSVTEQVRTVAVQTPPKIMPMVAERVVGLGLLIVKVSPVSVAAVPIARPLAVVVLDPFEAAPMT